MELKTFVAFLRGINVSGKNKIPMETLRVLCKDIGLKDVKTYIQSGNIVFKSKEAQSDVLGKLLADGILERFNFKVSVLVKTPSQLKKILEINPFNDEVDLAANRIYFVLLNEIPKDDLIEKFEAESFDNEEFFIAENCVYLKCNTGYGKAKLNNNLIERKLKVSATTRNFRTMGKLIELCN